MRALLNKDPRYARRAHEKYWKGETYARLKALKRERYEMADRLLACFDPVRSYKEVAEVMGVSKQRICVELREIFYKVAVRMQDPTFKP